MRSRSAWLFVAFVAVAIPSHAYRMSAWIPSWDAKAVSSMQLNAGKLDEANPPGTSSLRTAASRRTTTLKRPICARR